MRIRRTLAEISVATEKRCPHCDTVKPLAAFYFSKRHVDKLTTQCRDCMNETYRRRYARDPAKEIARVRAAQKKNPEIVKRAMRKYVDSDGGERLRQAVKRYYHRNRAQQLAKRRAWEKANPDKHTAEKRRWLQRRRQRDPMFRLIGAVGRRLAEVLNGKKRGRKTFALLGYTPDELRVRIECLFQPGMSWENYGEWHLDHIRPKASFNFEADPDGAVRECWALSNLQPLWGKENQNKAALWSEQHWSRGQPDRYRQKYAT